MSAETILQRAQRDARRHAVLGVALWSLPWFAALVALAWRLRLGTWPWLAVLLSAAFAVWFAWRRYAAMDAHWLVRTLDTRRPDMEDSAALLLGLQPAHAGLPALQRARLRARVEAGPPPDLRTRWNPRGLAWNGVLAAIVFAAILVWPEPGAVDGAAAVAQRGAADRDGAAPPRLVAQRLEVHPPAYTGLPVRSGEALSGKVPVGTTLRWTLRFQPQPSQAALVFHDGERLPLKRGADGNWSASRRIVRGTLYRIDAGQAARDARPQLHRIDAIADRAPRVRVLAPARTLDLVVAGQQRWSVAFEADDDYGLGAAQLRITRTVGSGENIASQERRLPLAGRGSPMRRRYTHGFDLAALGMVPGDDLIVQLIVSDRRIPSPQTVRGPSVILRWPPEIGAQATGLDAMMKKVMPAYFRSQRQIIIDAEALLKEKPRLDEARYAQRSDAIGVDQRLLRLRYGQFLGEESEGAPQLPTSDAPAQDDPLPTSDATAQHVSAEHENEAHAPGDGHKHADADEHDNEHGHDHAGEPTLQREAGFGEEQQVLERFGHTHDIPEAATLLDAKTRELLRSALNEMWQSEVHLRQAYPERALPYAYRALELIKKVQQSERVYLAKVGVELPPIDESRRLSGKRDGLSDRADPMRAAPPPDSTLADAWRALAPLPGGDAPDSSAAQDGATKQSSAAEPTSADLNALTRWLATHDTDAGDPLAIAAAIDALRGDPRCVRCRERLRGLLWPLLARPPAAPAPRVASDRMGDAYLQALEQEPRQ
jgi:hypothetical protein